jgi:hypothetical protein
MLTANKLQKVLNGVKAYRKEFFSKEMLDLDESGTRLMVNDVLEDVLGYKSLDEIRTEYMIKGTYADYVIQIGGARHFLVEVKALGLQLSDKHLRQAVNYAANEGIEWAVLTNGRVFQLYKIIFGQPIENKLVFEIDLSNPDTAKQSAEWLQYLHRDSVTKKGLNQLWNNFIAIEKSTIASLLLTKPAIAFIGKQIKAKFKCKFAEKEIIEAVKKLIKEPINLDDVKTMKISSPVKIKKAKVVSISPKELENPDVTISTAN